MNTKLLDPVPVRFRPDSKRRLMDASKRFKLPESEIVRRAVDAKLPEWERDGVIIIGDVENGGKA